MSTFSAHRPAEDEARFRAPKVITVPVAAFSWEWNERPEQPVEIGLRIVPDEDTQAARDQAARFVFDRYGDRWQCQEGTDCFNDALWRHRIARTTCQPDDVRRPWFRAAEDTVRMALSTEGVKLLAQEIEVFEQENSPAYKPATDDEVVDLAAALAEEPFAGMTEAEERATRRLLSVVLKRIGEARTRLAADDAATDEHDSVDALIED
jgi:hypothetical protein